jgi:DNA-binding GntR family transcriptional regulator
LTQILDRLWERTDRYRIMLVGGDGHLLAAAREHVEIANEMQARRARAVRHLVRVHIETARSLIDDALGQRDS